MQESVIYQEILAEGREEGREAGLIEGEQKAKEAIALKLLRAGMTISQIVGVTELSLEKVQQLQIQMETEEP
jgi:predicted transposase/invertase (TIGR01784 family)